MSRTFGHLFQPVLNQARTLRDEASSLRAHAATEPVSINWLKRFYRQLRDAQIGALDVLRRDSAAAALPEIADALPGAGLAPVAAEHTIDVQAMADGYIDLPENRFAVLPAFLAAYAAGRAVQGWCEARWQQGFASVDHVPAFIVDPATGSIHELTYDVAETEALRLALGELIEALDF